MTRGEISDAEWRARLESAGLGDPVVLLQGPPGGHCAGRWEILSKPGLGGRERWRWQLDGTGDGVLYVKRYLHTTLAQQVDRVRRQTVRHSRAWWEYRLAQELARRCIPAVRAIGFAERMRGAYEVCSAVLFERASGDAFDRVWPGIRDGRAPLACGRPRHKLTRALGGFVSAFHQTGLCHRDLYLCHIFADLDPAGQRPPRFTLIDLARLHRPRWRRLRWIIKDLSQLDCSAQQIGATRTDRLRFLTAYLGLELNSPRVRYYARRIVHKSRQILDRIARRSGGS